MSQHLATKVVLALLAAGLFVRAPVVPIQVALKDDLPEVEADESLSSNEVEQIVMLARGGSFVNLVEIASGRVNAPFTHVSLIRPESVPYEGSVEDRSDVVVGYETCVPSAIIAHCAGYNVYLRRTATGWKVVEKGDWIT